MKTLVIKGHPTRGREVIKILEMLGGQNISNNKGDGPYLYYIDDNNFIGLKTQYQTNFIIFTLEQFIEKYPYKVGDKVLLDNQVKIIKGIKWDSNNNEVVYTLETNINGVKIQYQVFNYDLRSYEEEIKEEDNTNIHINPDIDNKTTCDIKINRMKVNINDYTVKSITKTDDGLIVEYIKNKQYPKTYEECKLLLQTHCTIPSKPGYKEYQIALFQDLLICRDAYWKIAGEEMGLGKPWKPENPAKHYIFVIDNFGGIIRKNEVVSKTVNRILFFPTKEMRDVFYENFKDLIEKCKEFL